MKFFTPFFLAATVFAACDVCPEGPDRDLRIAVAFDATSNGYWPRRSLAGIADGLVELEEWASKKGQSLLVSMHKLTDGTKSTCSSDFKLNQKVSAITSTLSGLQNTHYKGDKTSIHVASMTYLIYSAWPQENFQKERRIFVMVTSNYPTNGSSELDLKASNFNSLCPVKGKTTAQQAKDVIRGHGVGILAWIWGQGIGETGNDLLKWRDWANSVGVTDLRYFVSGGTDDVPKSKQLFVNSAKEMLCPSYIATTTTYKP